MTNLNAKALGGLLGLLVVMAALLFVPAWTLNYGRAWAFLAVFGAAVLAITLYLMKHDPKLLERRVYAGPSAEKEMGQQIVQSITAVGFIAGLLCPRWITGCIGRGCRFPCQWRAIFWSRRDFSSSSLCTGKTALHRQPSNSLPIRRSYRRDHTRWSAIPCIWAASSCSLASHSHSARGGDCSSSPL